MRVLMLNNEFPPLGGGTGTVNRAILQRFASLAELEIDLITSALGDQREVEEFAERVHLHKVPVNNRDIHHSRNRELTLYALRALLMARQLQRARAYDFCFAWSAVPAGAVALALRQLSGLRYLVRVSGPDIPGFEQRYGPLYPILSPTIRAVWHGAEVTVAKCQGEAEMIHNIDRTVKVELVPNGVDLEAFSPAPIDDGGPLRILCVARLIERKGQRHLIEAVKRLKDNGRAAIVELIGEGDARVAYEQYAQVLDVADRVQFTGYVPREEIAAHYAAAHVFVLPSHNEGMSVATLEAMAAGLPVIVTRTGGTSELVEEGVNGVTFDWADVATLTEHLNCFSEDRSLARMMGAASRARAALFAWDSAAQSYLGMLEKFVHQNGAAR
jgi:glycosyltransferase involved in cell wall biosynthesis